MIFVGADHGGWQLARQLSASLRKRGFDVHSLVSDRREPRDDYPLLARELARRVIASPHHRGIAVCRTGVGMALVANKFSGIRAVAAHELWQVKGARKDEDANVLSLPADQLTLAQALRLTEVFLTTKFAALPRYRRRLREIRQIERRAR
jgi:ribose 5-phosphate isomerase B